MKIKYFEKGFNYSQDGPGNRLVYHLQGCNMKCPWCSNPEGMQIGREVFSSTVEELTEEIKSCAPMFFCGGGVTFTGGECTLQNEALIEVIERLKESGISVAIESNASTSKFRELALKCDYIIVDYKSPDAEKLRLITGGDLSVIEENIRKILKEKSVHIRIPLIHGFNDDDVSFKGFINFFTSLNGQFDVEILMYHEYGKVKWGQMGLEYKMTDGFVSSECEKQLTEYLQNNGIKITKS